MAQGNDAAVIRIDRIRIDGETQVRVALNEEVVAEYADVVDELPPVTLFLDGADYWLADGFHRMFAHLKAGRDVIRAVVRRGTLDDARFYSLGANRGHGLRMSNADKRQAVQRAISQRPDLSDREIAKHIGVSHSFVAAIRAPEAAERQRSNREASAARKVESDSTRTAPDRNKVESDSTSSRNPITPETAPREPTAPPVIASVPVEKPEPQDDDGPTLAELVDELQAENVQLSALIAVAEASDAVAEALKWKRLYDHAVRQQSEAMDAAARSEKREKWTHRQLMRCGKAVGEDDPTKIAPRVESLARERRAA